MSHGIASYFHGFSTTSWKRHDCVPSLCCACRGGFRRAPSLRRSTLRCSQSFLPVRPLGLGCVLALKVGLESRHRIVRVRLFVVEVAFLFLVRMQRTAISDSIYGEPRE